MIQRRVSLAVDLYEGTRTTRGEIVTDKRGEWGKKSQKSKMDDRERKRFSLFGMPVLDNSPNLQALKLITLWFRKGDWSPPKYVAECLLNRLETFVWENYEGEIEDEREVAQYILRNASCLETATFSRTDIHPEKRLERLKELESVVRASNSCQLVFK
ncbi:hypothetical protein YC2023_074090 [Brassica napus]